MDLSFSHSQAQRVVKQRNVLLLVTGALALSTVGLFFTASARDREIVLQPVLTNPMTLSSSGVSREYLEAVTRDVAVLTLNRTPQSLEYWMKAVLEVVHPAAYGKVKGDLLKIIDRSTLGAAVGPERRFFNLRQALEAGQRLDERSGFITGK